MKFREYENWGHFSRLKIKKDWKALDVGCGAGSEVAYLRSLGVEAYGLDNACQGYQLPRENIFIADARAIPCKSDCFDLVLCLSVIQNIPEHTRVVEEIKRILKKKGKFVIYVTNKFGITLKGLRITLRNLFGLKIRFVYFKLYRKKELANLFKNSGFKVQYSYTTRFIPYRLRSTNVFVGLAFWLDKNIFSKTPILKDIGVEIVIVCEK